MRSYCRTRAATVVLLVLLTIPSRVTPAIIVVDDTCSLADAINAANSDGPSGGCSAGSGADELHLTADVTLADVLPPVASDITVQGNGFTVARDKAAPEFRIFEALAGSSLVLANVTVTNGNAGAGDGGAVLAKNGVLTLSNTTLSGNAAERGGAIFASGYDVTLIGSSITDNVAHQTAPEIRWSGGGGGIFAWFSYLVVADGSLVSGNAAATEGGGIRLAPYAYTTIVESTLSYNNAGGDGGGVFMPAQYYSLDSNHLSIYGSTLAGNSSSGDGGAILAQGAAYGFGEVEIVNSTLSGNSATTGGAIAQVALDSLVLTNSTLSGNSATGSGGGISGSPALSGTIVANSPSGGNCSGSPVAGSDSFDDDGTCGNAAPIVPDVDFDIVLGDNGGPTLTHALLPGSVAIDAAGDCGLETDQRGFPRDDGACDSGAFEFGSCILRATLERGELRHGETLRVDLSITHNRPRAVSVPFILEVRDRRGRLVTDGETSPFTLHYGQTVRASHTLDLSGVPPGVYTLRVSMDEMRGGTEVTSVQFRIR